jgi:hypothetical protein
MIEQFSEELAIVKGDYEFLEGIGSFCDTWQIRQISCHSDLSAAIKVCKQLSIHGKSDKSPVNQI